MTKKDRLREIEAQIAADESERKHLRRMADNRAHRRKVVRDAAKSIRILRVRLAEEIRTLRRARGISNQTSGGSEVMNEIDKWTKRIGELKAKKSRLEHAVAIERLQRMFEEVNAMEAELTLHGTAASSVAPEEVSEEDIVS